MPRRGPDFVVIGPTRTGTSWLYRVLRATPGVWLPPIKELGYWSSSLPNHHDKRWHEHLSMRARSNLAALPGIGRFAHHAALRAPGFDRRYFTGRADDRWWAALFDAGPPGALAGELTPGYFLIDGPSIQRLLRVAPDVRLLTTLRDPIDRAWSVLAKQVGRQSGIDVASLPQHELLEQVGRRFLPYAIHLERWLDAVGPERLAVRWFDQLAEDPAAYLRSVLTHLGASDLRAVDEVAGTGAVNSATAATGGPPREVVEHLRPRLEAEVEALRQLLGAHPSLDRWLARE